ncbi:MAG: hypothetical protein QXK24_00055 [Ignisphaera sp.]
MKYTMLQERPYNNNFKYPLTIEETEREVDKFRHQWDKRRNLKLLIYIR